MSPNTVVVLVFFLTLLVWVGCFFGFMWWIGKDIEQIRMIVEEQPRLVRLNVLNKEDETEGGEGAGGKGKVKKDKGKGKAVG